MPGKIEYKNGSLFRDGKVLICPYATRVLVAQKTLSGIEPAVDMMSCSDRCVMFEVDNEGRYETAKTLKKDETMIILNCAPSRIIKATVVPETIDLKSKGN